jgi:hypothetical protein
MILKKGKKVIKPCGAFTNNNDDDAGNESTDLRTNASSSAALAPDESVDGMMMSVCADDRSKSSSSQGRYSVQHYQDAGCNFAEAGKYGEALNSWHRGELQLVISYASLRCLPHTRLLLCSS